MEQDAVNAIGCIVSALTWLHEEEQAAINAQVENKYSRAAALLHQAVRILEE